jgi:hypothetical protein
MDKMGMEIYIWAVGKENVQEQEMEQNASFPHDFCDGGGDGGGVHGGGGDGDGEDYLDKA